MLADMRARALYFNTFWSGGKVVTVFWGGVPCLHEETRLVCLGDEEEFRPESLHGLRSWCRGGPKELNERGDDMMDVGRRRMLGKIVQEWCSEAQEEVMQYRQGPRPSETPRRRLGEGTHESHRLAGALSPRVPVRCPGQEDGADGHVHQGRGRGAPVLGHVVSSTAPGGRPCLSSI